MEYIPTKIPTNRILPAVYTDAISYYELIESITTKLNEVIEVINNEKTDIESVIQRLEELEEEFEKFKESGFEDYYQQQVYEWISNNLEYIFSNVIKQIYFGINEQGYFVAYIPSGWSDIIFDTGVVYANENYGRLILRWNVNSEYTVNQTPETRI